MQMFFYHVLFSEKKTPIQLLPMIYFSENGIGWRFVNVSAIYANT